MAVDSARQMMTNSRVHWDARYQEGTTPWDTRVTPPEVKTFWSGRPERRHGIALDLGCGPGTNAAFLAGIGLRVIGIDLSGFALGLASQRINAADPDIKQRISFVQADVTSLPIMDASATYILDIGCLHGVAREARYAYARSVAGNLAAGGYYQLFAFDRREEHTDYSASRDRGMAENEVAGLFAPDLAVVDVQRGRPDRQPCRWYLLQKII